LVYEATAVLSYLGLFAIVFLTGAGLPLPEDLVVLGAGWLIHHGITDLAPTLATTLVAVVAGDVLLYGAGRRYGPRIASHPRLARRFPPDRVERAQRLFARWGSSALIAARLVPGLRAAVYLVAGTLRMPFRRFLLIDSLASLVHVPLLVGIGVAVGDDVDRVAAALLHGKLWAAAGLVVVAAAALAYRRRCAS
jgi:membrane protein DedA with SNARE-associated domain